MGTPELDEPRFKQSEQSWDAWHGLERPVAEGRRRDVSVRGVEHVPFCDRAPERELVPALVRVGGAALTQTAEYRA